MKKPVRSIFMMSAMLAGSVMVANAADGQDATAVIDDPTDITYSEGETVPVAPVKRTVTSESGDIYEVRGTRVFPNSENEVYNFDVKDLDAYIYCKDKMHPETPLSKFMPYNFGKIEECVKKYGEHLVDGKLPEGSFEYGGEIYTGKYVSDEGDVVFYRGDDAFVLFPAKKEVYDEEKGQRVYQQYMHPFPVIKDRVEALIECRKEKTPDRLINNPPDTYYIRNHFEALVNCSKPPLPPEVVEQRKREHEAAVAEQEAQREAWREERRKQEAMETTFLFGALGVLGTIGVGALFLSSMASSRRKKAYAEQHLKPPR